MIVEQTYNRQDIKAVLCHQEIWAKIAHDGTCKPEDFNPPNSATYICAYVDDKPAGLMVYKDKDGVQLECHFQVLPEYRKEYALEIADRAIQWAWDNTSAYKIVAEVPEIYMNVVNFGISVGFQVEGINQKSYLKDGKLYDQLYLGLQRK